MPAWRAPRTHKLGMPCGVRSGRETHHDTHATFRPIPSFRLFEFKGRHFIGAIVIQNHKARLDLKRATRTAKPWVFHVLKLIRNLFPAKSVHVLACSPLKLGNKAPIDSIRSIWRPDAAELLHGPVSKLRQSFSSSGINILEGEAS